MELNPTIFLQAFIIFVLMAWLSPMLFSPILRVFEERERRILGAADEARKQLGSADEIGAVIERRTRDAQGEARKVLGELRDRAVAAEHALLERARTDAANRVEEARAELFAATESARRALKDESKQIADDIVKKVLGRAV